MTQKWEYCVVGPFKADKEWQGYYPQLTYLNVTGRETKFIRDKPGKHEKDVLAETIARLGEEGWEMVTSGTAGLNPGAYFLYFKRPKA